MNPLIPKIVDCGIALAYSNKGAGIAGVWAEFLRQHIQITSGPNAKTQTWMVDGKAVWINEEFTNKLTKDEIQFIIAHETLHIALDHIALTRAIGATTKELAHLANIAQDAVINQALIDDGIGTLIKGGIVMKMFTDQGYTGPRDSVTLYEWLRDNPNKAPKPPDGDGEADVGKGCSPAGTPGDESLEGEGDQTPGGAGADQSPTAQAYRAKIRSERARATLKEASLKAGEGTAIADLLAPKPNKTSVRQLIRRGFEQASINALNRALPSYSRAGRRSVDDMIVTPGKIGTEAFVAFAGDVSGSMTDEGRATLIGFIESTAREFPSVRVFLVTHTDTVVFAEWMRAGGDLERAKKATGFSGGTDFAPAYAAVRDAGKKFDALVHFTDGYNNGAWPECPTRQLIVGLWGSGHGMTTPPPGTKLVPVMSVEGPQ